MIHSFTHNHNHSHSEEVGSVKGSSSKRHAQNSSRMNEIKSILLFALIGLDLTLNSTLDYDEYSSYPTMFGIQLFVQLCCFVVLFLMLCETYPFRVGLIDALLAEFRLAMWLHPIYFLFTIFLGLYRIVEFPVISGNRGRFRKDSGRWDTTTQAGFRYTIVSHSHKLFAAFFYFASIRAAVRLSDCIYYEKDAWVALFHKTGGSQAELRKQLQRRRNH
mmetsp:Transcript_6799/g.10080  ORF Transcript_6799/g.10080 Transcript_6799/m.10080 type:complete len:218 (-) Transcript_6799:1417-2070(-)